MSGVGTVVVCAVAIVALAALVLAFARSGRRAGLPVVGRPLLTHAELRFHGRLVRAVAAVSPRMMVFAQVAMAAVVDHRGGLDQRERMSVRGRFDRKIIDFVVTDASGVVLLLVELDDRTHDAGRDRARDAITAAAGHRTMRIRGRDAQDDAMILRRLREYLHEPS